MVARTTVYTQELFENIGNATGNKGLGETGDCLLNYEQGNITDIIDEIANEFIDIYTEDLFKWASDHIDYCNRAVTEGLTDGTDIEHTIELGEYLYYVEELEDHLDNALTAWAYHWLTANNHQIIEESTADAINDEDFSLYDSLEDIIDFLEDLLEDDESTKELDDEDIEGDNNNE